VEDASVSGLASAPLGAPAGSRPRRMIRVLGWILGVALFWLVLDLLGIDVSGWISDLWDQIKHIWNTNPAYIIGALAFQSGQTLFAGLSYYGILKAAYGREAQFWPIATAYAVGVAMNGFLPANIGTFVTLFMFVAIIPSCTLAGAIAAYMVQKIFFTLAGTFVYLYLFLSVPGAFDISFGNLKAYPILTLSLIGGGLVAIVIAVRALKRRLSEVWENAKEGGAILATPKRYLTRVFLPSFASWLCKLAVTGIFLGAFAIPVTFESIIWVVGSGSLANVASFTPGSVGVTQATNALALKTCCDVANDVAVDYSTAQQLIVTAWNQLLAAALLLWVFGWTGGKQLVGESYADAKTKVAETKEERRQKKEAKKEARRERRSG
jgi:glycosyltransferase 2 family protein